MTAKQQLKQNMVQAIAAYVQASIGEELADPQCTYIVESIDDAISMIKATQSSGNTVMRATILRLERLKNSVNGNPKYEVYYTDAQGILKHATTTSDAAFCYGITNDIYRESEPRVIAEMTFTKAGRINSFNVIEKLWGDA